MSKNDACVECHGAAKGCNFCNDKVDSPRTIIESMKQSQLLFCPRAISSIQSLETRAGGWNQAADGILAQLKEAGVQKGQVISIDAHNNRPDDQAIFSAHFCTDLPGYGELDISYNAQNNNGGWAEFYQNLGAAILLQKAPDGRISVGAGKTMDQIISMTASCNCGGRAVMYVFSYDSPCNPNKVVSSVQSLETRAGGWNHAADGILAQLKEAGVKKGQVISIDAHNNGPDEDAIFSAHFCTDLPGYGELDISYNVQNNHSPWSAFYENLGAAIFLQKALDGRISVGAGKTMDQIISMTASCNSGGRAVMYVFSYDSPFAPNVE